jgi:hypothetical protein
MPAELIELGLGVVVFFGAVIGLSLWHAGRLKQRALDEGVEAERSHLERAWPGSSAARRVWRLVVTDDATSVTQVVHDERRATRARFVMGPLERSRSELQLGGDDLQVLVQAPGTRHRGAAGGQYADSVVVRRGEAVVFEAVPWREGGRAGMRAVTAQGVLELEWASRWGVKGATVSLDGQRVGEVLSATDGTFKHLVAFDPKVPEAVLPWVFVMVRAGRYERRGASRAALAERATAQTRD